MSVIVLRKRRTIGPFLGALPFIAILTVAWVCGEVTGNLTGQALAESLRPAPAIARGPHVVS
jgi:hypothetical protein